MVSDFENLFNSSLFLHRTLRHIPKVILAAMKECKKKIGKFPAYQLSSGRPLDRNEWLISVLSWATRFSLSRVLTLM